MTTEHLVDRRAGHSESEHETRVIAAVSGPQAAKMDQLRELALIMFDEQGFEATTVDQLAERAGVSRRTFFRYFSTKEDVIFADHTRYLARLSELLDERSPDPVRSAAHALHALADGYAGNAEYIRRRARVLLATPALVDRELLWLYEYQQLITDYLGRRGKGTRMEAYAQVIAAALVAAMRQVVEVWALGESDEDPRVRFAELSEDIVESLTALTAEPKPTADTEQARQVVVVATHLTPDQIARLVDETEL